MKKVNDKKSKVNGKTLINQDSSKESCKKAENHLIPWKRDYLSKHTTIQPICLRHHPGSRLFQDTVINQ